MKKNIIILFVVANMLASMSLVIAQTTSSSSSAAVATTSGSVNVDKDTLNLKERLSKIVETRNKDQKAISGFATIKDNTISIKDEDLNTQYIVKIDDSLTKLYQILGVTKKEIKASDIKSDMYLIVTGPVADKTISANIVFIDESYLIQSGKITEVNKTDFYIKVMSVDKEEYTLDIDSGTKQNMINIKTLEIERTGFSKIKEGDTVHFAAKKESSSKNSKNHFAAQKILIIPQEYFIK